VSELKTREGSFTQLTSGAGEELFPTLSPDGRFVAYVSQEAGNEDIYLLRVGGENPINLTKGSTGDDTQPSFSPDGELIAFRSDRDSGGIFVMGATGESVRRVSDVGFNPVWSPDGTEIACATEGIYDAGGRSTTSKLWALNVATGEKRIVTEGDAVQPSWSPNGHRIAYWAIEGGVRDIWTLPAGGGDAVAVTEDAHVDWNPVWSPDGSSLYFSSDRGGSMNLWRVPIDEESGEVLGDPSPVTTGASAEHAHLSFSADGGRMAYVESVARSNLQEVSFDPSEGSVGSPVPITRGSNAYGSPDVSTDGQWLVFDSRGGQEDIFVSRTDGTDRRQLSNDIHKDRIPRWSPDGSRIAFYSNRSGSYEIWTIRPDGSGLQQLTEMPEVSANYPVWSPDGSRMTYRARHLGNSYILDPNKPWEEQTPEALPLLSDAGEYLIVFSWSPDGRWLAGWTAGGDRAGIAVFSLETREFQKLTDFGAWPQWLGDSRRLLFQAQGKILILDSGSKEYRELLAIPGTFISAPAVSKDGRTIYFTLAEFESDIWLMTVE
jgi:Tol biopolymer transport system component